MRVIYSNYIYYKVNVMKFLKKSFLVLCLLQSFHIKSLHLEFINPKGLYHHLSPIFLRSLTESLDIPNFIETGTFAGFTTEIAQNYFSNVNTFELSAEYYFQACEKFAQAKHVHPHWGDSGRLLPTVIPKLTGRNLFWLDAHYSGEGTAFAGCGTPIIEELDAIRAARNQSHAIIMIDDIRLFDLIPSRESTDAGKNFPDMTAIYNKLIEINPGYSFALLGDTLMAFAPDTNITVSPVVRACTLSRLSKCLELDDQEVKTLETAILQASENEKNTLKTLHDVYCHPNSNTPSPYYHIWYGLSLLSDNQYHQAAQQFERAITLNFNAPRVLDYLRSAQEKQ